MSATTSPSVRSPGDTDDIVGRARGHLVQPGRSLLHRLVATEARSSLAIARLSLGLVILPHALQKTFGWFGGPGFSGAYDAFTTKMGIPAPLAFLAIAAELLGSLALILGFLTRVGAAAIIAVMLGAIALVHLPHGFFMNWFGQGAGEGFEYHLLAIALGLVCLLDGGGKVSVDRALTKWRPASGGSVSPALAQE
ncbi:MAG TPA: DoxX family protein [Labilithrix sp.]|nr:DoxX family protein [Labilithrix sp.]